MSGGLEALGLALAAWALGFYPATIWLLLTGRGEIADREQARAHVHESFGLGLIWPLYLLILTVIGCAAVVRGGFGRLAGAIMPAHAREAERDADRLEKLTLLADAAERESAELDRQLAEQAGRVEQDAVERPAITRAITPGHITASVITSGQITAGPPPPQATPREAVEAIAAAWGIAPDLHVTIGRWRIGYVAEPGGYRGTAVTGQYGSITGWRCAHVHPFRSEATSCAMAFAESKGPA